MTTSTFAAITGDFSAQLAPEHQAVATLLERIFVLMKIIGSHGTTHPSTHEMASAALSALRQCRLPSALQFVREAVFYDRTLVPLDIEGFKRGQSLSQAMNHCGVHEVSFESGVDETALIAFFEVLSKGLVGPNDLLEQMRLPGISWREIPGAGWGAEAKPIDPDLFAVTQVSLAVADTDLLADAFGQPWNWAAGVSILRRLERAVEVDARAADRAVELVPVPWSAGRRAVAMPKSISFTTSGSPGAMTTLSGLRSRCRTCAACSASRPLRMPRMTKSASRQGSAPRRFIRAPRSSPLMNSITMQGRPAAVVPKSAIATTLGWRTRAIRVASRSNRLTMSSLTSVRILTATAMPSRS